MSPVSALAQGMAVPGEASVSETGAARYSIPIATPPGTAGVVPSLSLSYDSHSGNGLLGMGWQLEGLAAIGRCPRTMAQDGVRGSINYDANDRFCLDGQRLIAITGTYGADGTEYRTEIESFTKVISRGVAGTGPAWFEVRTKSGQVMEFGNSTDSRILAQGKPSARSWAVNKVADTKGNFYAVTYVNDAANGEAYPSRIDYTGNAGAGLAPYNSVRFVYDAGRPDATTAYHAGSMVRSSVRMSKVQTYVGAALVSDYRLAFAQGASTGRSQLTSITICDGGGACLPATSFTWQQGTTNYTVVNNVGGQDGQLANYRPYIGDFNGDGLSDIFWDSGADGGDDRSSGNHVLWTNTGNNGFQVTPNWLGQDGTTVSVFQASCNNISSVYYPFIADFNRDGRSDVLWYNKTCGHKNNADARESKTKEWFSNANGSYTLQAGPNKPNRRGGDDSYYSYELRLVEIDGDNRIDIIWHKGNDNSQLIWAMQPNGSVIESILTTQLTLPPSDPFYFGNWYAGGKAFQRSSQVDFNADGKTDILWLKSDSEGLQFVSLGDGQSTFTQASGSDTSVDSFSPTYGDLNGDGQTDILWDNTDGRGRSEGTRILWFSQGDGNFIKLANVGGQNGTLSTSQHRPYIADFNGDGLPDVLWDAEDDDSARTTGQRVLWTTTGQNQLSVNTNFSGQNGTLVDYAPSFGDFNGDGKTDILWDRQVEDDSRSQGQRVLWLSDGIAPDLITAVTDGLGASVSVTYKSLSDSAVYAKENTAVDPVIDMQGAIQVVARVDQADGIGGLRSIAYRYAGAKAHQDGRGFLGFREVRTTDLATGFVQTTTYRQDYPLTGMVAQETKTKDGAMLGTSVNTHVAADLGGTRRQVTLTQSVTTGTDLDASPLPSATTGYQYDGFGNATQITVTSSDGFSKVTTNTYTNDTANWLLGRLATATVTSQAPDVAAQLPGADGSPNAFDFTDVTNAELGTVYQASTQVSGFNVSQTANVTGAGAQIRKNGVGDWGSSIVVLPGDTLNVRMTSSGTSLTSISANVTVGSVGANWIVTTARDITPNSFDFTDVTAPRLSLQEAAAVVSGFDGALAGTVSGGGSQVRKNGTGPWGPSVDISNGETLNVRMSASSAYSTQTIATITLGTATVDWRITSTAPASMVLGASKALTRTLSTSSPGTIKFTYSLWVKFTALDGVNNMPIWQVINAPTNSAWIVTGLKPSQLVGLDLTPNSGRQSNTSPAIGAGVWHHLVFRYDSSEASSGNRIRIYQNGTLLSGTNNRPAPGLNAAHPIFTSGWQHQLGAWLDTPRYHNGKLAFVTLVDGQSLGADAFAFSNNGVWSHKPYESAFGAYGFFLDGSTGVVGQDVGPNGQNFTGINMNSSSLDTADVPPNGLASGALAATGIQTAAPEAVSAAETSAELPADGGVGAPAGSPLK